ncbi:MAG: DUF493 domain-containing protein [Gammaproteobacteria bacterium]|nr:DUF493 domain-containing protein [Gammaproteobacteria bacterium]
MSEETLFEFPCEFPIKVMGQNTEAFEIDVLTVINQHVDNLPEGAITSRPSGKGNYISITITITAHSKQQLDNIYLSLNACETVMMCL